MNNPSPTAKERGIILMDKNSILYQFSDMHMNGCRTDEYKKEMPPRGNVFSWQHEGYAIMVQAKSIALRGILASP